MLWRIDLADASGGDIYEKKKLGAMMPNIRLLWEDWADQQLAVPAYETTGAAGADIRANFGLKDREAGLILAPMARAIVPTGLRMEIPHGYEVQIRARSGLAAKHGIGIVNGLGTVDSDYRGPIGVLLINWGDAPFEIAHGDRIAQLIVAPVLQADFDVVSALSDTDRGAGGFGSTGRS